MTTTFEKKAIIMDQQVYRDEHRARERMLHGTAGNQAAVRTRSLLSRLVDSDDGFYNRAAADVLADVASWSYSDCQTMSDALLQRTITDEAGTCDEVAVLNGPMLVVATCFFIRNGSVGVISFRGTEPQNAINFLTDANVQPKNFLSLGRVHGGFYRNVAALWPELKLKVEAAIADPQQPLTDLYITGHSLGGAMAVIAAAMVYGDAAHEHWRPLVRGVYTYGQPMVGDREFARSCDDRFGSKLFRHVYGRDLVPRLPPLSTGHFVHFGAEYAGSLSGWYPQSTAITQAKSILLSVPIGALAWALLQIPALSQIRLPYSLNDHSPNSYLEAFRAARN